MNRCIFCKSIDGPFRTREHILPESLGGGEWAILPPGLFCDSCQNAFGSSIEQQALDDYPFNLLRVFLGIPTKKGKAPWLQCWEGRIASGLYPGQFHYDPAPPFAQAMKNGAKGVMRIPAVPLKPAMICRALLKMGLEVVAGDNPADVFLNKYDAAREFALRGVKDSEWWYLQIEDHDLFNKLLQRAPILDFEPYKLSVSQISDGDDVAEVFYLKLFFVEFVVPLESRVVPAFQELKEPKYQVFRC